MKERENTVEGCEEAKRDALEVWKYLYEHPTANGKEDLPAEIKEKIKNDWCQCPLCEIFFKPCCSRPCQGCPLEEETDEKTYCPLYSRYQQGIGDLARGDSSGRVGLSRYLERVSVAAKAIYDRILAWDTDAE